PHGHEGPLSKGDLARVPIENIEPDSTDGSERNGVHNTHGVLVVPEHQRQRQEEQKPESDPNRDFGQRESIQGHIASITGLKNAGFTINHGLYTRSMVSCPQMP